MATPGARTGASVHPPPQALEQLVLAAAAQAEEEERILVELLAEKVAGGDDVLADGDLVRAVALEAQVVGLRREERGAGLGEDLVDVARHLAGEEAGGEVGAARERGGDAFPCLVGERREADGHAVRRAARTLDLTLPFSVQTPQWANYEPLSVKYTRRVGGQPFLSGHGALVAAVRGAIRELTGLDTVLSTAGGTSDGRFIAPTGTEVVEFGPINASIHKINEHVAVGDLQKLAVLYQNILKRILTS